MLGKFGVGTLHTWRTLASFFAASAFIALPVVAQSIQSMGRFESGRVNLQSIGQLSYVLKDTSGLSDQNDLSPTIRRRLTGITEGNAVRFLMDDSSPRSPLATRITSHRPEINMPVLSGDNPGGQPIVRFPAANSEIAKQVWLVKTRLSCAQAVSAYIPVRDQLDPPELGPYIKYCLEENLPPDLSDVDKASVGITAAGDTNFFCSGIIVEPGLLMTAKHCFFDPGNSEMTPPNWSLLKDGKIDIVSSLGRMRVACRKDGDASVDRSVTDCAHEEYGFFDLPSDFVVLSIPDLKLRNFKGLKRAKQVKRGADLFLYSHFDASPTKRFSSSGCSVREVVGVCVVHDCQAQHRSSGGGLLTRDDRGQMVVLGLHLAQATDSPKCGLKSVTDKNVGIALP